MAIDQTLPAPAATEPSMDQPVKGILIMLLNLTVFAVLNDVVKDQMRSFPANEIIFFRNAIGLLPLLALLPRAGGTTILRPQMPWLHLAQAATMSVCLVLPYTAFDLIPLAEVTAILFLMPVIMTALAHFFLKEKAGLKGWLSVIIGFGGVLVIVRPDGLTPEWGALAGIIAAVFAAIAML